jgi:hypothetical protein
LASLLPYKHCYCQRGAAGVNEGWVTFTLNSGQAGSWEGADGLPHQLQASASPPLWSPFLLLPCPLHNTDDSSVLTTPIPGTFMFPQ